METKRRLAAILFADIVGYTNQSHKDETKALAVRKWVNNIVRERGLIRGGRVVKSLGDGSLLEFSSAVEAVSCAIEIQEQVHLGMGGDVPGDQIQVRIGIHVGDVVEEDGDVLGDAVNIASRVQGTALPGGICITREVYTHIRPILRLRCKRIPTTERDRLPDSVEVLAIDEKEGATSVTLQAVKRNNTSSKVPILVTSAAVLGLIGLAFAMGWVQIPVRPGQPVVNSNPNPTQATANPSGVHPGVTQETKVVTEDVPFETKRIVDASLKAGESKVLVLGVTGKREVTYELIFRDGKEIGRGKKSETLLVAPTAEVLAVSSSIQPSISYPDSVPEIKAPIPPNATEARTTRIETRDVIIPFRTQMIVDQQLDTGKREVVQNGQTGIRRVTVQLTIAGGRGTNRKTLSTEIVQQPVDQIVKIGKRKNAPEAPPAQEPPVEHPSWFCPECGVRWPGSKATCPNDGTKRPPTTNNE